MLKKHFLTTSFILGSALLFAGNVAAEDKAKNETDSVKMPIEAFAIEPAMRSVSVSRDGKKLAYMRATSKRGDYVVEIRPTSNLSAKPVTLGAAKMELTGYTWLNNKKLMMYFRQNIVDGARNYWVSKNAIVNADGKGKWDVPFAKDESARFSIVSTFPQDPDVILLNYDIDEDGRPDIIRYDIDTGRTRTILRGNDTVNGGFVVDSDGEVRAGTGYDATISAINLYARSKGSEEWQLVHQNKPESREVFDFLYFNKDNPNEIFVSATLGQNTAGIYRYNIETKEYSERLFGLKSYDADSIVISNKMADRGRLLGYSYTGKHPKVYWTDENEAALYEAIEANFPKKFVSLNSRSEDDNMIVIRTSGPNDPGTYYLLENKTKLSLIGDTAPLIDNDKLAKVRWIKYKARDGMVIPAYVTIPQGKGPFPTIVHPHGGPWSRDVNIYDEWSQLLANNGYLVVQPQFRGSTGFGLELWKAGDAEWGKAMQDDLDDAALYLVEKGLADKDRLAMFGWSFGGYASLVAATRDPQIYKCSAAGASVGDLNRWLSVINRGRYLRIFQSPTVRGIDPVKEVSKVNIPLYVVHGDIDRQVTIEHSRDFIEELKKHTNNFKYTEIEGADHFSNTLFYEHKMQFYGELVDWFDNYCFSGKSIAATK
ncbi:S9 family peptidase [Glaciecola sp. MH2013]|nr:S9 family peptidase [Glaciecola sp. MH2013]